MDTNKAPGVAKRIDLAEIAINFSAFGKPSLLMRDFSIVRWHP
jgi:hypothetical protein